MLKCKKKYPKTEVLNHVNQVHINVHMVPKWWCNHFGTCKDYSIHVGRSWMQNALKIENKSHNELKFSLRLEEMGIEQNIPTA